MDKVTAHIVAQSSAKPPRFDTNCIVLAPRIPAPHNMWMWIPYILWLHANLANLETHPRSPVLYGVRSTEQSTEYKVLHSSVHV